MASKRNKRHNRQQQQGSQNATPTPPTPTQAATQSAADSDDDVPTVEFRSARSTNTTKAGSTHHHQVPSPRVSWSASRWRELLQGGDELVMELRQLGSDEGEINDAMEPVGSVLAAAIATARHTVARLVATGQAAVESELQCISELNAALHSLSDEVPRALLPPDAAPGTTLRDRQAQLAAHRAMLEGLAHQRLDWLCKVVDVWSAVQHDIADARAAMERDAHRLDDVLGRASTVPGATPISMPSSQSKAAAHPVESPAITSDDVRRLGRAQDLSMRRIDALIEAANGLLGELWNSAEQRVEQRRGIVFGLVWARAKAVAARVAGNRNSFCAEEALSELEHARNARARHLEAKWQRINEAGVRSARSSERESLQRDTTFTDHVASPSPSWPPAIEALLARRSTSNASVIAERLAAVDAEERFALDRVCYYSSAGIANLGADCAAHWKAYYNMTSDPMYAGGPQWSNDIPVRFRPMLLAAMSDDFLVGATSGDSREATHMVEALSLGLRTTADTEINIPAAEILCEIELLDALRGDLEAMRDVLHSKIEFATVAAAAVRRRAALLEENAKYTVLSARDRLTSRKPHQAQEMMKEAKVRQQMREVLPVLERSIYEALHAFDEKHPDYQTKVAPLVVDGIIVRDQVLTTLDAPVMGTVSRSMSLSTQGAATPPPRSPVPTRTPLCATPSNAQGGATVKRVTTVSAPRAESTFVAPRATGAIPSRATSIDGVKRGRSISRPDCTPMRPQPTPQPSVTPMPRTPPPTVRRL